jgi:hypothetical protein
MPENPPFLVENPWRRKSEQELVDLEIKAAFHILRRCCSG